MVNKNLSGARLAGLFMLAGLSAYAQQPVHPDIRPLVLGTPVERELKGDEAHSYSLVIQAGQFLDLVVQQKGIDIVVTLFDPSGKKLAEVDSPNGAQGPEPLAAVIETAGNYRLEVRSLENAAPTARYEVRIVEMRNKVDGDNNRIKARQLSLEGETLGLQRTRQSMLAAVEKFKQASLLYQSAGDRKGEALALSNVARYYGDAGEYRTALEYLSQLLPVYRAFGDKLREGVTLNNIGLNYRNLGEKQKAVDHYLQALSFFKEIGNQLQESFTLFNLGVAYSDLGEIQKALDHFSQSLPIMRSLGRRAEEAFVLQSIGTAYFDLGEFQRSLSYLEDAVRLSRQIGQKRSESQALMSIGSIYFEMGQYEKALEYRLQALTLQREIGHRYGEAGTLTNIGNIYTVLGKFDKALEYHNEAIPIFRETGDKGGEGAALVNSGEIYSRLLNDRRALDHFSQALPLVRSVDNRRGEVVTHVGFFKAYRRLANPRAASFFGKLAVNNTQILRSNITGLNKNIQQTFLKSIEGVYRETVSLLIAQQRIAEAQQLLNLFKDQQYFDFNSKAKPGSVSLTQRERQLSQELDRHLAAVVAATRSLDELIGAIGSRQPNETETAKHKQLDSDLQKVNAEYRAFLTTIEVEFAAPSDEKDKVPEVADVRELQDTLKEMSAATKQNTVAVYTLVGEDNYSALVVTPEDMFSVSAPIKGAELNKKALQLWSLLRSPKYDPRDAANELYKTVFAPLEAKLPKGTGTILWSLDGSLRYIPIAALYDGKRYLAERFENVIFTRSDKERMTRSVNPALTGTGMGSSEAHAVELTGEKFNASALPSVKAELDRIFKGGNSKGVLTGGVLLDSRFTRTAMLAELKQRRPLVHIASHFKFEPGDEARSFLLLGDGTPFTLDEMKKQTDLFSGVDLLTLSACQTAAQRPDANGREVDGFAELAQRLGAGAVMASLWEVSDDSTAELMSRFYRTYRGAAGTSKAAALRRSQMALLTGMYNKPLSMSSRQLEREKANAAPIDQTGLKIYRATRRAPYAHPYYWSPFVLIGNWK